MASIAALELKLKDRGVRDVTVEFEGVLLVIRKGMDFVSPCTREKLERMSTSGVEYVLMVENIIFWCSEH